MTFFTSKSPRRPESSPVSAAGQSHSRRIQSRSNSSSVCSSATTLNNNTKNNNWISHWTGSADAANRSPRAVWAGRILFLTVLAAVATVLGYVTFRLLTTAEENLAVVQFESIGSRALVEAEGITRARRWAGVTLAAAASELYPNATQWPFVEFLGFERLVRALLQTSHGVDMGIVPYLMEGPEQWKAFEEFAYRVYYEKLGWDNTTTAVSKEFGRGIWGQTENEDGTKTRYHDTTGETTYNSPYTLLSPIYRTDEGAHPVLLFNTHSGKPQGEAIDKMLNCSNARREAYEAGQLDVLQGESNCGVITDIFPIVKHSGRYGAALLRPIYPVNDPLTVSKRPPGDGGIFFCVRKKH